MWHIQIKDSHNFRQLSSITKYEDELSLFADIRKTYPVIRYIRETKRGVFYRAFHPQTPGSVYFEVWENK